MLQDGLVITNYGKVLTLLSQDNQLVRCVARRKLGIVVSGDRVKWQAQPNGEGVVLERLKRHTVLERPDRLGHPKPLAANITQLLVVNAFSPPLDRYLIDQYCLAAEHIGTRATLIFNKSDLWSEDEWAQYQKLVDIYTPLGYPCLAISSVKQEGLEALLDITAQHTSIMVGQSGVGKSSIAQMLLPDLDIRIGALSQASGLGAHTTTSTTYYPLSQQGALIDSPGVREFKLYYLDKFAIERSFVDMAQSAQGCRFNNCLHQHEPRCAVKAAVEDGTIDPIRYQNYSRLLTEVQGEAL